MSRETWSRRRLLGALAAGATGGLAGCSFGAPENTTPQPESGSVTPAGGDDDQGQFDSSADADPQTDGTAAPESAYAEVYQAVSGSVAAVRVGTAAGTARGTAWVYDDQHLVTNEHVVADAEEVSVWFDGYGWRSAETVATDVYSDLAAVRIEDKPDSAPPLSLVDSQPPVGTEVVAVGNPFGLSGSVSAGIVSGQNRTLPAANGFSIPDAVQTDAAVNPGNSGGPLVDLDGDVVGVVNAGGGDNIGFAISAAVVKRVIPALIQRGNYAHSYMGVELTSVTPPLVEANDLSTPWGVYIDSALPDAPADGVLEGSTGTRFVDGQRVPVGGDVVLRMDGTAIPTQQALSSFLALETSPQDTVDVEVVRDGRRQTVQLTLGRRPKP